MKYAHKITIRIVALTGMILFFVGVIYKLSAQNHSNSIMILALLMNLILALFCIYDVIKVRKPNTFAWVSGFILFPGIAPFLYAFTGDHKKDARMVER